MSQKIALKTKTTTAAYDTKNFNKITKFLKNLLQTHAKRTCVSSTPNLPMFHKKILCTRAQLLTDLEWITLFNEETLGTVISHR